MVELITSVVSKRRAHTWLQSEEHTRGCKAKGTHVVAKRRAHTWLQSEEHTRGSKAKGTHARRVQSLAGENTAMVGAQVADRHGPLGSPPYSGRQACRSPRRTPRASRAPLTPWSCSLRQPQRIKSPPSPLWIACGCCAKCWCAVQLKTMRWWAKCWCSLSCCQKCKMQRRPNRAHCLSKNRGCDVIRQQAVFSNGGRLWHDLALFEKHVDILHNLHNSKKRKGM
jgi:hypothetical protein